MPSRVRRKRRALRRLAGAPAAWRSARAARAPGAGSPGSSAPRPSAPAGAFGTRDPPWAVQAWARAWASVWACPEWRSGAFRPGAAASVRAPAPVWAAAPPARAARAAVAAEAPRPDRRSRYPARRPASARRGPGSRRAGCASGPTARTPGPCRAPGAATRPRRACSLLHGLHLQTNLLHALLAQLVHHLQHRFIARVLVAADQHGDILVFGAHAFDEAGELRAAERLLVHHAAARVALAHHETLIALHEDLERHDARRARLVDGRQIDDSGRHERRGHHEDDKQHEHHVDVGHDVDLVHRPALLVERHQRTWRCRMFENSSMKLSKRLARRSMSCE